MFKKIAIHVELFILILINAFMMISIVFSYDYQAVSNQYWSLFEYKMKYFEDINDHAGDRWKTMIRYVDCIDNKYSNCDELYYDSTALSSRAWDKRILMYLSIIKKTMGEDEMKLFEEKVSNQLFHATQILLSSDDYHKTERPIQEVRVRLDSAKNALIEFNNRFIDDFEHFDRNYGVLQSYSLKDRANLVFFGYDD